ncbi:MAG: hypothetical protein ABI748_04550 [Dokdonella sp.]
MGGSAAVGAVGCAESGAAAIGAGAFAGGDTTGVGAATGGSARTLAGGGALVASDRWVGPGAVGVIGRCVCGGAAGRDGSGCAMTVRGVGVGAGVAAGAGFAAPVALSVDTSIIARDAASALGVGAPTRDRVAGASSAACAIGNASGELACGVGTAAAATAAATSRTGVTSAVGATTALRVRRGDAGLSSAASLVLAGARLGRGVTPVVAFASFFGALRGRDGFAGA